ncbi:hypothetical protein IFM5058_04555 [Aspergillus udagawae]|nr:hypothetical protein IFM5058_04555 [Aspergillus udagawae]
MKASFLAIGLFSLLAACSPVLQDTQGKASIDDGAGPGAWVKRSMEEHQQGGKASIDDGAGPSAWVKRSMEEHQETQGKASIDDGAGPGAWVKRSMEEH